MHRLGADADTQERSGWPGEGLQDSEPTQRIITKRVRDKAKIPADSDDAYEILGVKRNATAREIRAAYLRLVKELHPDGRTPDRDDPGHDASERLKAINAAYRQLKAGGPRPQSRAWRTGMFAVGVLTSALPLIAIGGAYHAGWLSARAPTPVVAAKGDSTGDSKGGSGTTSVQKDTAVGRQLAFADATKQATKAGWARFIADYPGGEPEAYARQAIAKIERAEEHRAWSAAAKGTKADIQRFLAGYANGEHAGEARLALAAIERAEAVEARKLRERLAWAAAAKGSKADLQQFLASHPDGQHAGMARLALAAIERAEAAEARKREERLAWAAAEKGSKGDLQRFIARYADGEHAAKARLALAAVARMEEADWAAVERLGTKEALQGFLDKHPDAVQAPEAGKALAAIEAERLAWANADDDGSKLALRAYLSKYPAGRYAREAKARVARLEIDEWDEESWRIAVQGDSKVSYAGYLAAHPDGRRVAEAYARLAELERREGALKDAVKEARAESVKTPPAAKKPPTAPGGEAPYIGADGRIRR